MQITNATQADFDAWLALAAEVEHLFGPMVSDEHFHGALRAGFSRGTAWCIRVDDGPPGTALVGGMLFAKRPPGYEIAWLAVASAHRRFGAGIALVRHAQSLTPAGGELTVVTFGADVVEGAPARRLYERAGFIPAEMLGNGPEGGSRQLFRARIPTSAPGDI